GARREESAPDVVVPAEDHAGLGEAGHADVGQRGLAAGALEAAVVPVAVQRVQQVPVQDLGAAAGAAAGPGLLVLLRLVQGVLLPLLLAAGASAGSHAAGPPHAALLLRGPLLRPLWPLRRRRRLGCPRRRRLQGFDHAPAGVPAAGAPRARLAAPHGAAAAAADAAAASLLGPCHHRVPPGKGKTPHNRQSRHVGNDASHLLLWVPRRRPMIVILGGGRVRQ
ncbi:unnamed protein product, partial [Ixodes persulcatus]